MTDKPVLWFLPMCPALEGDLPTLQPLVQPLSVFAGLWSRVPILPLTAQEIGTVLTRWVTIRPMRC